MTEGSTAERDAVPRGGMPTMRGIEDLLGMARLARKRAA